MERKNVIETIKKWRLFFIVLAKNKQTKKNALGESYKNTVISAIVAISCSLQQRVNKFIWNPRETAPDSTSLLYSRPTVSTETSTHVHRHGTNVRARRISFYTTQKDFIQLKIRTKNRRTKVKLARIFGFDSSDI